jgi:hypothetical protein
MNRNTILMALYYIAFIFLCIYSYAILDGQLFIIVGIVAALLGLFIQPASSKMFVLKIIPPIGLLAVAWIRIGMEACNSGDDRCFWGSLANLGLTGAVIGYLLILSITLAITQRKEKNLNL